MRQVGINDLVDALSSTKKESGEILEGIQEKLRSLIQKVGGFAAFISWLEESVLINSEQKPQFQSPIGYIAQDENLRMLFSTAMLSLSNEYGFSRDMFGCLMATHVYGYINNKEQKTDYAPHRRSLHYQKTPYARNSVNTITPAPGARMPLKILPNPQYFNYFMNGFHGVQQSVGSTVYNPAKQWIAMLPVVVPQPLALPPRSVYLHSGNFGGTFHCPLPKAPSVHPSSMEDNLFFHKNLLNR